MKRDLIERISKALADETRLCIFEAIQLRAEDVLQGANVDAL